MIDPQNGRLSVSSDCVIAGALTKSVFKSSSLFREAKPLILNPPFESYRLPDQTTDGRSYSVSLWFEAESLKSVQFSDTGSEFGTSWSDWSEEKEGKRKQKHDGLLTSLFGRATGYVFTWGRVESLFDPRSGGSFVIVTYNQPNQALQHNDPSCHVSCLRTPRASRDRG